MSPDKDFFQKLNQNDSITEKIGSIHEAVRKRYPFIDRIAVAIYDPKTDMLKTFSHSSGGENPLSRYQARLSDSRSLSEIYHNRRPRLINNLATFAPADREHSRAIKAQGYRASYTMPMFMTGVFFGFVFFDSRQENSLSPEVVHYLNLFGHLVSLTIINDLMTIKTMLSTVKAARDITAYRDMETGAHLDRMSHYARLIAREMADRHGFDDEFIEYVFLFSPLHDIGKIGVPDQILRKAARLSPEEFNQMKDHTIKGRAIVDAILKDFGLDSFRHIQMMRNITEFHHEHVDGNGYPHGLKGDAIPIEARIISVADIFDALTSERPYKPAWTNEEAFDNLREIAGAQVDSECVEALIKSADEILQIQARFKEELYA
jgi:HD-GYP domain-containing protein (c-di-GMP phosphodiesterase class II)